MDDARLYTYVATMKLDQFLQTAHKWSLKKFKIGGRYASSHSRHLRETAWNWAGRSRDGEGDKIEGISSL